MKTHYYFRNKSILLSCFTAVAAIALFANGALAADKPGLSDKDKAFVTDATEGGLAEIQMGELGKEKATNPEVKSLSEMLVTDHTKANADLAEIVKGKGGEVPTSPSVTQKANLLLLKARSGNSFDKAFAKDSVDDHKKVIAMFEKASKESDDADLKAFATKTLPALKEHLSMSEKALASAEKEPAK